jgi:branched-chain amino acid transport system permease protein
MNYIIHILIMIGIYLILIYSLNLITGFGGLLSLCHAAFYGIGAYTYAILTLQLKLPFVPAIISAMFVAGFFAFTVGIPALRFRGDMFVIVTLGFQMIIFTILYNWISFTRGPYGIPGIPQPVDTLPQFFFIVLLIDIIALYLLFLLYKSPFGLVLKSLREDERAAEALGKHAFMYFLYSFTIGGGIAGISGALFASYVSYIDPTSFTLEESIFQVCILLLGGSGNIKGPFVGVLFMIILPEVLRFIGLPDTIAPNVRQIIYGSILTSLMFLRPKGICGEFGVR